MPASGMSYSAFLEEPSGVPWSPGPPWSYSVTVCGLFASESAQLSRAPLCSFSFWSAQTGQRLILLWLLGYEQIKYNLNRSLSHLHTCFIDFCPSPSPGPFHMLHRTSFICFCYIDIKFQEFSLVYMCEWLYVCGCMYMIHHVYMNMFMLCMCMCMCVWRSENNPSCPSSDVSSIFCLRQGFLLA